MSILIKGMEMPKNCDECPLLTKDGDYDVCFIGKKRVMWEWKHDKGSEVIHPKPDFCPLIEIPPHGRLIDETVVLDHFVTLANIEWNQNVVTSWANAFAEAASDISDIPTVIPTDKDGET